jgi:GMP synthase-like glutamine amidotransferase
MRAHWFQHVPFEGLGSIDSWLHAAGAEVTSTKFFEDDPVLPRQDDVDLLVIMGGPMSVNDESPLTWLADEKRFVRKAIDRGTAVLGVCLGAQLIASALGARVYANGEREIGWLPITGLATDPGLPSWAAAGHETTVFHWHGETFDLPSDAEPLARSVACEHQAFRIGRHVIGLQFHLETTAASAHAIVANCRAELVPARYVQAESDILAADAARYSAINGLMAETLGYLLGGTSNFELRTSN